MMAGPSLSWSTFAFFVGAVVVVAMLSELIKPALKRALPRVPARAWVYLVAVAVVVGADILLSTSFDPASLALDVANAIGVALAAMGAFDELRDAFTKPPERG